MPVYIAYEQNVQCTIVHKRYFISYPYKKNAKVQNTGYDKTFFFFVSSINLNNALTRIKQYAVRVIA